MLPVEVWILMLSIQVTLADIRIRTNEDQGSTVTTYYKIVEAAFGPKIPQTGLEGYLTLATPEDDACTELYTPPDYIDNWSSKWIVLIARGNCTFERKVRNAQDAKYNAVIIYGNLDDEMVIMKAANPVGINIPSVFVDHATGKEMEKNYCMDETDKYYMVISRSHPGYKFTTKNWSSSPWLPWAIALPIIVLFMIIAFISLYVFNRYYEFWVVKI